MELDTPGQQPLLSPSTYTKYPEPTVQTQVAKPNFIM